MGDIKLHISQDWIEVSCEDPTRIGFAIALDADIDEHKAFQILFEYLRQVIIAIGRR